ncbi:MAG: DNA-binding protein [Defluviitaleaceae bacterium]|nr:DNA-binding protein [Defluviitaleaceae bacterium]
MDLEWITPEEAGNKWEIKSRQVQALCANGQVDGAIRMSRVWLIPKDAPKPIDGRTKAAKNKKTSKHGGKSHG